MRKYFLSLAFVIMLLLSLSACSFSDLFRDEEAERTPDVDFYIQYASERFGVPAEEISVVYFQKGTHIRNYTFSFNQVVRILVTPVVRLEWGGKTVTFSYPRYSDIDYYDTTYLRDDYYYDELYEGVRQYFRDQLEVEDVIVRLGGTFASASSEEIRSRPADYWSNPNYVHYTNYKSFSIRDYIVYHDVTEVTTDVVKNLLKWADDEDIWLYVELAGDDPETEIRALIDKMMALNRWIRVIVMSQLDEIEVYRETPDPYEYVGFDTLRIDKVTYDNFYLSRVERAKDHIGDDWVVYKGYMYSRSELPQAPEQTEESGEESETPEQTEESGEESEPSEQMEESGEEPVQAGE